jgi:hypothetical protein
MIFGINVTFIFCDIIHSILILTASCIDNILGLQIAGAIYCLINLILNIKNPQNIKLKDVNMFKKILIIRKILMYVEIFVSIASLIYLNIYWGLQSFGFNNLMMIILVLPCLYFGLLWIHHIPLIDLINMQKYYNFMIQLEFFDAFIIFCGDEPFLNIMSVNLNKPFKFENGCLLHNG